MAMQVRRQHRGDSLEAGRLKARPRAGGTTSGLLQGASDLGRVTTHRTHGVEAVCAVQNASRTICHGPGASGR